MGIGMILEHLYKKESFHYNLIKRFISSSLPAKFKSGGKYL